jgi:outer membrane receptor protein involved in Fe transport
VIAFSATLLFSSSSFAQEKETAKDYKGKLSLAKDKFINGNFEEADGLLDEYIALCADTVDVSDYYYKLRAQIYIARDQTPEAKQTIVQYIGSKIGNYISDDDPQLFKDLFYEVQDSLSGQQITSVSKKPEDMDLAAATLVVIKESEFVTRGYTDIVDLLSDLPGFDISRIYAANYANVYQRGFRQENTERTLLLIDGIEENDAWSNIAYLSRQYPLSNISSVEVVYGPASTIYGARAFAGAINIITKSAAEHIRQNPGILKTKDGAQMAVSAKALAGSYGAKGADLNMSGRTDALSFSLTGRLYSIDGRDLSGTSFYDYNPADLDKLVYDESKLLGLQYVNNPSTTTNELNTIITRLGLTPGSANYNYFTGYGTDTLRLNPDSAQALLARARQVDKEGYQQVINGNKIGYANKAWNYYIGGKVKLDHFEAGFRTWTSKEGYNYYQDLFAASAGNGSVWAPKNSTFYTIYERQFRNLSFSNTSSYVIHGLNKNSDLVSYNSFYGLLKNSSYSNPSLFNIIFPDSLIDGVKQGWQNTYFYYKARQFRNDFKLNYTYRNFNLLAGLDLRSSQLQGDYLQYRSYAGAVQEDQSETALAEELGTVSNQSQGANQYNTLDAGLYTQATFRAAKWLNITGGGRYDYNRIRQSGGFGGIFNPKLALVFYWQKIVIKTIYSQGIQNPSQFTKFSTGTSRNANPNLVPERIKNMELVLQNRHGKEFRWDVSGYYSIIEDAVASSVDPDDTKKTKNQNSGTYTIAGAQSNLHYVPKKLPDLTFTLNGSYTFAQQTENNTVTGFEATTIGDIAPLKANFIVNYHRLLGRNDLNFNLRTNYVTAKPVGPETTISLNRGVGGSDKIPAYAVLFGSIMYKNKKFEYLTLQFTVNNILNTAYYAPGPRTANGDYISSYNGFVPYVPQQTRNYVLTLNLNL